MMPHMKMKPIKSMTRIAMAQPIPMLCIVKILLASFSVFGFSMLLSF